MSSRDGLDDSDGAHRESVLGYIEDSGETSLNELSEETGLDKGTLFRIVNELLEEGELHQIKPFTYRPIGFEEAQDADDSDKSDADSETDTSSAEAKASKASAQTKSPSAGSESTSRNRGFGKSADQQTGLLTSESRSRKEQAWGAVLLFAAFLITTIAGISIYSVISGGILGILSIQAATAIGEIGRAHV